MKCPHSKVGIAEAYTGIKVAEYPQATLQDGSVVAGVVWVAHHQRCPECHEVIILLHKTEQGQAKKTFLGYPPASSALRGISAEVTAPYSDDFQTGLFGIAA
jgi:hypothetical protein